MKAVVVGGTGFLGLNIVAALRAEGHEVIATRRRSSNTIFLRRLRVPMVPATLEEVDSLTSALVGADVVFFAAAHYPRFSIDTARHVDEAVHGARNLIEAMRRAEVRRLVYTGSVVTVGRPADDRPARETDQWVDAPPDSTYFAVKMALEKEIETPRDDLDPIILCPTGCLGPFDHKVGTGFFVAGLANRSLNVYTDGSINVVDARDVARTHVRAATAGRTRDRYILGGHNVRVKELLQTMARLLEVPMPQRCLSESEAVTLASREEERCHQEGKGRPALSREIVDMIVHGQFVDSTRAEKELEHQPRPLEETIRASHQWYRDNGFIQQT